MFHLKHGIYPKTIVAVEGKLNEIKTQFEQDICFHNFKRYWAQLVAFCKDKKTVYNNAIKVVAKRTSLTTGVLRHMLLYVQHILEQFSDEDVYPVILFALAECRDRNKRDFDAMRIYVDTLDETQIQATLDKATDMIQNLEGEVWMIEKFRECLVKLAQR
jgi:hypothetical protein